jgi:hypothetical protein
MKMLSRQAAAFERREECGRPVRLKLGSDLFEECLILGVADFPEVPIGDEGAVSEPVRERFNLVICQHIAITEPPPHLGDIEVALTGLKPGHAAALGIGGVLGRERSLPCRLPRPCLRHEGSERQRYDPAKIIGAVLISDQVAHQGHIVPPLCTTGAAIRS